MVGKKIKIFELLSKVYDPLLCFFNVDSDEMLDLKIEVLTDLKNGKTISEIPKFYEILELYPEEKDREVVLWDL